MPRTMAWCAGARRLQDRRLARAPLEPSHAAVRGAGVLERLAALRHADLAAGLAASRGRQRGWALCTQLVLVAAIAGLGWLDPKGTPVSVAVLAILVAFFSATQDIVLNAYQREILPDRELGLGTAMHVNAYRLASLVPGSLALILADHLPWSLVFASVAAFMLV